MSWKLNLVWNHTYVMQTRSISTVFSKLVKYGCWRLSEEKHDQWNFMYWDAFICCVLQLYNSFWQNNWLINNHDVWMWCWKSYNHSRLVLGRGLAYGQWNYQFLHLPTYIILNDLHKGFYIGFDRWLHLVSSFRNLQSVTELKMVLELGTWVLYGWLKD